MSDVANTEIAEIETEFKLDELEKTYFSPDDLQQNEVVELVQRIIEEANASEEIEYRGLDLASDEIHDGWGILALPVTKRQPGDAGNKLIGVCVFAVPDPATVVADEKGNEFVRDAVIDAFGVKLANSVRPRGDDTKLGTSWPKTFEEFITRRAGGASSEMKAFNALAGDMVKGLRQMGLKTIDKSKLRMVLQSTAAAEAEYPKVAQEIWERVIHAFIKLADEKKLDTTVFNSWLETRNETTVDLGDEIDTNALDKLFG